MARLLTSLAKARVDAGLTIDELSAKAGVSAGTIMRIESGITKRPQLLTLKALADALGVTLAYLLTEYE
jgi:transcriptional regulator with XRE-family HTH domain